MRFCQAWLGLLCSFLMTPPGKLTVAVLSAQPLMWVIMTSQTCSQEERRSGDPCSQSFFLFFYFPVAYYSERKREGETETRGEIKYLAKTRMRFCVHTKCAADWCFCLCCYCLTQTRICGSQKNFLRILPFHLEGTMFGFTCYIEMHHQQITVTSRL